jgi:hypothetical protein
VLIFRKNGYIPTKIKGANELPIVNERMESKPERLANENKEVYELSSDITAWNLYEQSWQTLVTEGLSKLFENENEFKGRKLQWHETMEQSLISKNEVEQS